MKKDAKTVLKDNTMIIVLIAWVLFAFTDFSDVLNYLGMMFGHASAFANIYTLYFLRSHLALLVICALACTPVAKSRFNFLKDRSFALAQPLLVLFAALVILLPRRNR